MSEGTKVPALIPGDNAVTATVGRFTITSEFRLIAFIFWQLSLFEMVNQEVDSNKRNSNLIEVRYVLLHSLEITGNLKNKCMI